MTPDDLARARKRLGLTLEELATAAHSMTPEDMRNARMQLGLTLDQLAKMLGYQGVQRRQMQHDLETGRREIRAPQRRLIEAYLSGYRPADWPVRSQTGIS